MLVDNTERSWPCFQRMTQFSATDPRPPCFWNTGTSSEPPFYTPKTVTYPNLLRHVSSPRGVFSLFGCPTKPARTRRHKSTVARKLQASCLAFRGTKRLPLWSGFRLHVEAVSRKDVASPSLFHSLAHVVLRPLVSKTVVLQLPSQNCHSATPVNPLIRARSSGRFWRTCSGTWRTMPWTTRSGTRPQDFSRTHPPSPNLLATILAETWVFPADCRAYNGGQGKDSSARNSNKAEAPRSESELIVSRNGRHIPPQLCCTAGMYALRHPPMHYSPRGGSDTGHSGVVFPFHVHRRKNAGTRER